MADLKDFERQDPISAIISNGEPTKAEQLCDRLIAICESSGVSKFDLLAATCGLVITSVGQFNLRLAKQLAAYVYHATLDSDWDDEFWKDIDAAAAQQSSDVKPK